MAKAIKGPLPPIFSIVGTTSKFALLPAASPSFLAKGFTEVKGRYLVAVCRWSTTCKIESKKPSKPSKQLNLRSWAREPIKRSAVCLANLESVIDCRYNLEEQKEQAKPRGRKAVAFLLPCAIS